jgi:thermitase
MVGKVDVAQSTSTLTPGSSPCGPVDETTILDFRFHGTFVASQIVTNNIGIAGVAPLTEIIAVKSLNCTGNGSVGDVISGILYAADLSDASVINMSLGGIFSRTGAGSLISALNKAVNYANSQGKLVVSAAGNEGLDLQHSGNLVSLPAEAGAGISIYATAIDETLASYSNHGVSATWVGAPGGDFPNPAPPLPGCVITPSSQSLVIGACSSFQVSLPFACGTGSYVLGTGTSFASPLVAGVAALVDGKAGGSLGPAQLKTNLKNTADDLGAPGTDNLYSHGRVNASSAVQ